VVLASALRDVLSNPQQPRTQAFLASIRDSGIRFVLYLPFFTGDGRDTWLDIVFLSAALRADISCHPHARGERTANPCLPQSVPARIPEPYAHHACGARVSATGA